MVVVVVCWVDGRVEMSVGMCVKKGKRTKREDVSGLVVVGGGGVVVLGCCWWWWWIGVVGPSGRFYFVWKRSPDYTVGTHLCFSALANFAPSLLQS